MADKEITSEMIIQALECCSNEERPTCDGCPLDEPSSRCVPKLMKSALELVKSKDSEIDILIRKKHALRDEIAEQQAEKERLGYVLMAVMHSVDKWLEGDELKQDEANRACTMREKTLKITEKLHKKIDDLKKNNQEQWVAIERRKSEIERLKAEIRNTDKTLASLDRPLIEVKLEAYKEFAARLYAYKTDIFIKGEELMIIPLSDYEIILKELIGE